MRWLTLFSLFFIFTTISCSHKERVIPRDIASLKESDTVEGIWFLQGTSSIRGPYNGELEFRKATDGTYDVVRIITYINYFYAGLKVQEVWTGKAVASDDSLVISYEIDQADFITKLGGSRRSDQQFQGKARVDLAFKPGPSGLRTSYSDRQGSSYSEWITTRRDVEPQISWQNRRVLREVPLPRIPQDIQREIEIAKKKVGFEGTQFARNYLGRQEYKDSKLYIVKDPTDFDFYRENKDTIRIVNKITDNISIAESVVKRNAYAPTLEEKARGYEGNTIRSHLNEAGVIAPAYLALNGDLELFEADRDSALRTGLYLAAQSMRYSEHSNKATTENLKRILRALITMLEISEGADDFARTIAIYNPRIPIPEDWQRGTGKYANFIYLPGARSEHLNGIIHGVAWAINSVPREQTDIHTLIRQTVDLLNKMEMVRENETHESIVAGLNAMLEGENHAGQALAYFRSLVAEKPLNKNLYSKPLWFVDWRQTNLELMDYASMVLIATALNEPVIANYYQERIFKIWSRLKLYKQPLLDLAVMAYTEGSKTRVEKITDEELKEMRSRIVWGLREVPYPRPSFDVSLDHSKNNSWSLSRVPKVLPDERTLESQSTQSFYKGIYAFPIFEIHAYSSSFIWSENPFEYQTKQAAGLEMPGVDYLYAYWLARWAGLIDEAN